MKRSSTDASPQEDLRSGQGFQVRTGLQAGHHYYDHRYYRGHHRYYDPWHRRRRRSMYYW